MKTGDGPLSGFRVLDFTRVLAGPYATALLADLGADVIKVEGPQGDEYRHVGPFRDGESALFQTVNRGKRSVVLDLKDPRDVAVARDLAAAADVVVENFRPGVMARLGLGAEALMAANPKLVYASISGFGQSGPNADRPAYDIILQAMTGLMHVTGHPDGPPTMVGEAMGDVAGGVFATLGIVSALLERERTGRGRLIDVALHDSLAAMMPTAAARVLICGENPQRSGNCHALSAPFGVYPAGTGYFAVAVLNDHLFSAFCNVIGQPGLAADPRFASDTLRRANEPALALAITDWAANLTAEAAVTRLAAAGVPAAELTSAEAAWTSAQSVERALHTGVTHPAIGQISVPEQPVHFAGLARGGRRAAPTLDQDGAAIRAGQEGWR
ncbi:CaiB/BaiF CoA transferase family protein [Albidovulum sediminicola]|uniref:CoA transferase n=1 Tax=Albidovulum sediminicola TaxID=2984331 RepID=A0ABT2Z6R8_9RHOB|nr:CoA transferase [Defluviimonas sp. WL0075]MCV2866771.1 CoA transferase [Defluviimonas sp. WL0075]